MQLLLVLICFLTTIACAAASGFKQPSAAEVNTRLLYPYESSVNCRGCHYEAFEQYQNSMHAKSFNNPLFKAKYFKEIVPKALKNPEYVDEARKCLKCHAPVVYMNNTGLVATQQNAEKYETGVTCDFCHTLVGYAENGDYLQNESGKKQGPLRSAADAVTPSTSGHSELSGFFPMAEYCGVCHDAGSHGGLEVQSTFEEWRESSYGKRRLVCQECHMDKNGFLKNGVAEYASGAAATLSIGNRSLKQKEYEQLHTHAFPGAHSNNQLDGALLLDFLFAPEFVDDSGYYRFDLAINNERAGHKMPSGSSDLRFMWLVVTATGADGSKLPVTVANVGNIVKPDYSIAGFSPSDTAVLGSDVPQGSRLYRLAFIDENGVQSLFNHTAAKSIFDNRLNADEVRKESYEIKIPPRFSGPVTLSAALYYRGAPGSFTKSVQAPDFKPLVVASGEKKIVIPARLAKP